MDLTKAANQFFFATVKIEADKSSGMESGTGFIFSQKLEDENYLFIVTSKHLCQSAPEGRISFTKKSGDEPDIGNRFDLTISDFENAWTAHPDSNMDVAIMPLVPILDYLFDEGVEVFFTSISSECALDEENIVSREAVEDVLFYSYADDWYDQDNYLPIICQGSTATPIYMDYKRSRAFLVNADVLPGGNGSPIFMVEKEIFPKLNGMGFNNRFYFLGLLTNCQQIRQMGIALKASVISDICMTFLQDINKN
tara:strand:+ start:60 stop:818 length:759 start_codon:yes stop_codon:yes gene_type:complete